LIVFDGQGHRLIRHQLATDLSVDCRRLQPQEAGLLMSEAFVKEPARQALTIAGLDGRQPLYINLCAIGDRR
jgi:hypothetical protein